MQNPTTCLRMLPLVSDQMYVELCSFPPSTIISNEMFSPECVLGISKWYQVSSHYFFFGEWLTVLG